MNKEKFNTLEEAVQPLLTFLNENYDPMTIAIIEEGKVDILRKEIGIHLKVRD